MKTLLGGYNFFSTTAAPVRRRNQDAQIERGWMLGEKINSFGNQIRMECVSGSGWLCKIRLKLPKINAKSKCYLRLKIYAFYAVLS